MNQIIDQARHRVTRLVKNWRSESSLRRFVAYCRRRWPWAAARKRESVVLMGYGAHKIAIYCKAHAANYLARRTDSEIETYNVLGQTDTRLRRIYEAFGASLGLDASFAESERDRLKSQAEEIVAGLKTKRDLLDLRIDGLKVGDLLYNSYLRYYLQPTVDLRDPRLRDLIFETLFVYTATVNYLRVRKVTAFLTGDFVYHECGVIARVMMRAHVPVYIVCHGPRFFLYRMFGEEETGWHDYPIRWPYHRYREVFQTMDAAEQERCLEVGRRFVDGKLAGEYDRFSRMNVNAYGDSGERVFPESGKPRVVIMMHDFVDAPHWGRWMLFEDFHEWGCFLMERAAQTPFEWYLKPHPGAWDPSRRSINEANANAVEALLARYPHIKFLPPTVSNRQIVQEGVSAIFTMYGSAGHEFARLGVPTVNAADNPHIAYDFNYHPRTVEEYVDLINRADQLVCEANHRDIDEYCFMNFFYYRGYLNTGGANPMPREFFEASDYEARCAALNGYDLLLFPEDPEREAGIQAYYEDFFGKHHPEIAAKTAAAR